MRDYCSKCGETFLNEHIITCECGRSLCSNCLAVHKQRYCQLLFDGYDGTKLWLSKAFNPQFLDNMDSHIEKQNPKVWVLTKASPEKVVTTIDFNTPNPSLRHKKLTINLNEYQQKLVQFDNNENKVLMDYMHQLQAIITKQSTLILAENKQLKEEASHQENCNSNSYNATEANQTADFFNSLTLEQKKHVKAAHSKHNVRGITGYSEYLKNINM